MFATKMAMAGQLLRKINSFSFSKFSSFIKAIPEIRNVAIIAHVDHGKTTLVDALLKQSGLHNDIHEERLMDCNVLEKERGITILAKVTTINREPYRINLVERILNMVNGVILVVDAVEGPMAQTKFVLSKALRQNLNPIVVINKVDRVTARTEDVECELLDLFMMLGASDSQLSYPIVYASAKEGWASLSLVDGKLPQGNPRNMDALFKEIITNVPHPKVNRDGAFSMLVNSIENNQYIGRCSFGLIHSGSIKLGDQLITLSSDGIKQDSGKVTKMFVRQGLLQNPLDDAAAGDIITLAGIDNVNVNSTICSPSISKPLPTTPIDPPTMSVVFATNNSPLAGKEGKAASSSQLGERLRKEVDNNVALKMKVSENAGEFEIFARGELQLGILVETMRREGMEFSINPPKILLKTDENDETIQLEPIEEVILDVDLEHSGIVMEKLCKRKGEMKKMSDYGNKTRLVFECPTRGLLGFGHEFKHDTRGTGILNHSFLRMSSWKGPIESFRKGSIISMADGMTTGYALKDLEERGVLFIKPGTTVYGGMVIGECNKDGDLDVNPIKTKNHAIARGGAKDDAIRTIPPKEMSIEELIAYMGQDEIIEVTPMSLRLRKKLLDLNARRTQRKIDKAAAMSFR